jgi:hypothetical protein
MNRRSLVTVSVIAVLGLAALPGSAVSQQKSLKDQLVGNWTFVSSTAKLPDGSPLWGSTPKGLAIFTDNGRFSEQIMRSDRPKFASNNRLQGTPDDNKAASQATISSFGTYAVDEANKTVAYRYEASSYPNWEGTEIKRPFTIRGGRIESHQPNSVNRRPADSVGVPARQVGSA